MATEVEEKQASDELGKIIAGAEQIAGLSPVIRQLAGTLIIIVGATEVAKLLGKLVVGFDQFLYNLRGGELSPQAIAFAQKVSAEWEAGAAARRAARRQIGAALKTALLKAGWPENLAEAVYIYAQSYGAGGLDKVVDRILYYLKLPMAEVQKEYSLLKAKRSSYEAHKRRGEAGGPSWMPRDWANLWILEETIKLKRLIEQLQKEIAEAKIPAPEKEIQLQGILEQEKTLDEFLETRGAFGWVDPEHISASIYLKDVALPFLEQYISDPTISIADRLTLQETEKRIREKVQVALEIMPKEIVEKLEAEEFPVIAVEKVAIKDWLPPLFLSGCAVVGGILLYKSMKKL